MQLKWKYLLGASLIGMIVSTASAGWSSSHREAPGTEQGLPRIDSTDMYMFRSYEPGRDKFVTLIANYLPLQDPYGGPNYFVLDNDAVYEIHVDNTGDAVEDLTFQFRFNSKLGNKGNGITLNIGGKDVAIPLRQVDQITDRNDDSLNEKESYTLKLVEGDRRSGKRRDIARAPGDGKFIKPVDNIGNKTLPDYAAYAKQHIYAIKVPGCGTNGRVFVGQRAEAFAVNLGPIFDLVNFVPIEGDSAPGAGDGKGFPGGITQDRANDDVVGKANVTSLALELPIACLVGKGNGVIGAWTTASLPRSKLSSDNKGKKGDALVQVSRLSAPLVNEVVIGLKDKDLYSGAEPIQDGAVATYVTNPTLPALLDVLFRDAVNATFGTNIKTLAPTNFPRGSGRCLPHRIKGLNQQKTVTASEMMRLNTAIMPTPRDKQSTFGVAGGDLAGFPNGRRPGDDAVDLALRVVMGRLCYDLPIGKALGGKENNINLGLCKPKQASVGNVAFTDGAPISATELKNAFPYLNDPIRGRKRWRDVKRAAMATDPGMTAAVEAPPPVPLGVSPPPIIRDPAD